MTQLRPNKRDTPRFYSTSIKLIEPSPPRLLSFQILSIFLSPSLSTIKIDGNRAVRREGLVRSAKDKKIIWRWSTNAIDFWIYVGVFTLVAFFSPSSFFSFLFQTDEFRWTFPWTRIDDAPRECRVRNRYSPSATRCIHKYLRVSHVIPRTLEFEESYCFHSSVSFVATESGERLVSTF